MRICILTQPLEMNYGGILQAYALQKALTEMGHEVTTLRFKPLYAQASSRAEMYWKIFRRFLSKMKGNKAILFSNPEKQWEHYRKMNREIERFISENINFLEADIPLNANKLPVFDAYIVGSDQVWRPVFSPHLPDFYLGFLEDERPLRIAFAASFGVDGWESSEKETALLRKLAQRFDRISVREASGVELCRNHLGMDAELMPDPTMLLTREDYLTLCPSPVSGIPDQPYIATYIIDPDNKIGTLISDFAERSHLPVVSVGGFDWERGSKPMEHWLAGIANARFVITDSFHGTVFSLLFQKDFITFINGWRGPSRYHTLLDTFGLSNRLVCADQASEIEIPPLDNKVVSQILPALRERGLSFLAKATSIKRP